MKDKPKQFTLQDIVEDLDRRDSLERVFEYQVGEEVAIIPDKSKIENIYDTYGQDKLSILQLIAPTDDPSKLAIIENIIDDYIANTTSFEETIKKIAPFTSNNLDTAKKFVEIIDGARQIALLFTEDVLEGKEILKGKVVAVEDTYLSVQFSEAVTLDLRYLDVYKPMNIDLGDLDDI